MSTIDDGGPAFPVVTDQYDYGYEKAIPKQIAPGMSLRDAAALKAMQGLCANPGGPFQENGRSGWGLVNCTLDDVATTAYALADAMLKARQA